MTNLRFGDVEAKAAAQSEADQIDMEHKKFTAQVSACMVAMAKQGAGYVGRCNVCRSYPKDSLDCASPYLHQYCYARPLSTRWKLDVLIAAERAMLLAEGK